MIVRPLCRVKPSKSHNLSWHSRLWALTSHQPLQIRKAPLSPEGATAVFTGQQRSYIHQGSHLCTSTTIIDSQIFGNVFSTPEIRAIWSDRQRTAYFLHFEAALAKVQAKLGVIPRNAADQIVKHCDVDEMDFDELRKQTELIGYPVLPVVQQLVRKVNQAEAGLGEWAHWGVSETFFSGIVAKYL